MDAIEIQNTDHLKVLELLTQIKKKRQRLGITQETLAEMIGMDRSHYSKIEKGKKPGVTLWFIIRLVNAMNMELIIK